MSQPQIMTTLREHNEPMLAAGRKVQLELLAACERAASALASSQEELAETAEVEWLSRLLRAQATFTREMAGASGKFGRELLEVE
jgi:hypothetical protein